jgi:hypothetical protein
MSKVYVPKYAAKGSNKNYLGKENNVISKLNEGEKADKRNDTSKLMPNPKRIIDKEIQYWHCPAFREAIINSPNNKKEV